MENPAESPSTHIEHKSSKMLEGGVVWGDIWHCEQYKNKDNHSLQTSMKCEQIKFVGIGCEPLHRGL